MSNRALFWSMKNEQGTRKPVLSHTRMCNGNKAAHASHRLLFKSEE
jgi:hypothetical protein